MHSLIVTIMPPPRSRRDYHGVYRRLKIFIRAIAELCETIEILHFVDNKFLQSIDWGTFIAAQTDYWEVPIKVRLVPKNPQPRQLWQLGTTPFSIRYRGDFWPFLGKCQIAALSEVVSSQIDFIFVHRLEVMNALLQVSQELPPIFFDLDDIQHWSQLRYAANSPWPRKIGELIKVPMIFVTEHKSINRATKTFVCSETDQSYLSTFESKNDIVVVPNAVNVPKYRFPLSSERTILYLGNFGYYPNAEAAERLISRIFPRVLRQIRTASLVIAGNYPERIPAYHSDPPNVEFTGLVHDLDALYRRSRVICCPIVSGGGTRIKLIEAAAYARPIVATPIGAEGLKFENGREILIYQADDQIADACSRLLVGDALCQQLGQSAYQKARSVYDVTSVTSKIAAELRSSMNARY